MTKRQLGARIDAELYRKLRVLAAERDVPVATLLEEAVTLVLRKYRRRVAP
ncbi:MAG: hypothetical protein JWM95_2410 [Gemmatimonadetes bacterium]|nr:hypothetical protein [Gemmatimonadota bacterium]